LRIHFDNVNFASRSGPNTFAGRLATVLTERGHEIVDYSDPHDAVLVFIEPTRQWKRNVRVVQRLDGIWFKPNQFKSHNRMIKWTYENCDAVVWQSKFDKDMTCHHWKDHVGTVIRNGIDADKVVLTNSRLKKIRRENTKVYTCSANWHRQKRLKENIEAYDILTRGIENTCLVVMGSSPDVAIDREDIIYTGNIRHNLCLEVYSMADAMIHLAWLDHCPNVVVEALSQKCPVICTDSGGTKELVGSSGIIIPEAKPYNFELLDYDNPHPLDLSILSECNIDEIEVDTKSICLQATADAYEKILRG
jgi:glycosyltransferase involved in cell wall biosynthesis